MAKNEVAIGSRVLGVSGSPRRNGNSDILLRHALKGARMAKAPVERLHLRDYLYDPCIGCERCRRDQSCTGRRDGMQMIYPRFLAARGLVLTCPTHNYNLTAWMKAFIDRLYCFYDFGRDRPRSWSSRLAGQGRLAVLVAVCEQPDEADMGFTLPAMRRPLEALGYEIVAELPVYGIFDRGRVSDRPEIIQKAESCGRQLAQRLQAA
jgi:multimeric flavodoxin WrbA